MHHMTRYVYEPVDVAALLGESFRADRLTSRADGGWSQIAKITEGWIVDWMAARAPAPVGA